MTVNEYEALAKLVASLPLTTLLVLILVGGYKGWWIYGNTHDRLVTRLERDRDEWKALALEVSGLAHSVVKKLDGTGGAP